MMIGNSRGSKGRHYMAKYEINVYGVRSLYIGFLHVLL